ncbi:hypothetical protein [Rhizobium aethiopicum]|uniref:Uncharacterized protein n=1 Tax=Rhizobium aethiopicum TaxID=1138170 RepID=A0A7W6QC57_9HYPH|nr:hypothetical protein [Rhizobium aethiopicum]MBB4194870.1 hypothetical protein [Rhizobium aethiopicum]
MTASYVLTPLSPLPVLRLTLLCGWCSLMAGIFLWSVHPIAYDSWHIAPVLISLLWFSGPLVAFAISAGALIMDQPASRLMKRAVAVHFGVSLAVGLVVSVTDQISPAIWLFLLLAALVDLPILALAPGWIDSPRAVKLLHMVVASSVAGPIAALFLWSALNIKIVEWRALAVAGSHPYCVQVPKDYLGQYKAVTQRAELAGLRMRTPFTNGGGSTDYQFAFHAVLVVRNDGKDRLYNWSYFAQSFVPVSDSAIKGLTLRADCEPMVAFFDVVNH